MRAGRHTPEPMAAPTSVAHQAFRWRADGSLIASRELLAAEEPLEIRLGGRRFTLTMRTPGHDHELTAGFLFSEGFIASAGEIGEFRAMLGPKGAPEPNVVDVVLDVPAAGLRERLRRNFVISSSCGVCGKTSIEALQRRVVPVTTEISVDGSRLLAMVPRMRAAQVVFEATGGLHAAALFSLTPDPASDGLPMLALREDVGRHNAVDKLIGWALLNQMVPLESCALMVSGRLSFELVQKAAAAGIPIVAAVSAPSALAVQTGQALGLTVVGFLRERGFNIYTRPERVRNGGGRDARAGDGQSGRI
jgi:FdhD protein